MAFFRDAKTGAVGEDARKALEAGRVIYTPRLNFPSTQHGLSGDIPDWSAMIEAVESAGWRLTHFSVAQDAKGRPEAYCVFRRG